MNGFGHPVFWLMVAAVAAPLLAEIPIGIRLPVVVLEVILGVIIGPHVLDLARSEGFVETMFVLAMAVTLFMAGMEIDFEQIGGRPLALGIAGWVLSVLIALVPVALLHIIPGVNTPWVVTLALCTSGLGVLLPVFRDTGALETPFGRMVMAAGVVGELGPIVGMSFLLSTRGGTWHEIAYLLVFLGIVGAAIGVGIVAHPPRLLAFLTRHLHASTQLPVRFAFVMVAGLFLLAEQFGFESIFGAFAAGLIVGQTTRGPAGEPFREKIDAVSYGWFYPFFFVGTGIKFNLPALFESWTTILLLPTFLALFLVVRGVPAFLLYRRAIARRQHLPLALASAVPSLSIIVVITEVGMRTKTLHHSIAVAMVGAALLALLLFPTIASAMLSANAPTGPIEEDA